MQIYYFFYNFCHSKFTSQNSVLLECKICFQLAKCPFQRINCKCPQIARLSYTEQHQVLYDIISIHQVPHSHFSLLSQTFLVFGLTKRYFNTRACEDGDSNLIVNGQARSLVHYVKNIHTIISLIIHVHYEFNVMTSCIPSPIITLLRQSL